MNDGIDITGLDKAEVLAALYNKALPLGMGRLQYVPGDLPVGKAREFLRELQEESGVRVLYFDYLQGRVMKVDITGDMLDPRLYDRDNGEGAAAAAIATLRK